MVIVEFSLKSSYNFGYKNDYLILLYREKVSEKGKY